MKKMNEGSVFMAIAGGRETTDATERMLYIGVGSFKVITANPTAKELEEIFKRDIENEPVYVGKDKDSGVDTVRIEFLVKSDEEKNNGINLITKIPFFLRNEARVNKDKTKVQVVDKYGRFAWATVEEAKAHAIPQYKNGPAALDADYRPAYVGEEDLTEFIKIYLNIPAVSYKKTQKDGTVTTVKLENPSDAECRLDSMGLYFKGNTKEIKDVAKLRPDNLFKLPIGIKTTDDNKQYQDVYTKMILKNGVTDYSKLDAAIKESKENGLFSKTEFSVKPLHKYEVTATSFSATPAAAPTTATIPSASTFGAFFGGGAPAPAPTEGGLPF